MKKLFAGIISLAAALIAVCAITVCAGAETSGDYEYSVLDDGTVEITRYIGDTGNITIPNSIDGKSVTSIGRMVFSKYYDEIEQINIPDSVTSINKDAFYKEFSPIYSIEVDNNNKFYSSLNGVLFNKDKTTLIYFPRGKKGEYSVPDSVTRIESKAFYQSLITSVKISDTVTSIGASAFNSCDNLSSVILSKNITNIENFTFSECVKLTSIDIPNGVTNIGPNAFYCCESLTTVTMPESVISISACAFQNVNRQQKSLSESNLLSIKDVYYSGSKAQWNKITIGEYNDNLLNATIHFAKEDVPAPSSVSGLKLKGRSGDALRISWTKNTSADGYIVEMKDGSKWVRVGKITKNSTVEFKKSKLKAGTAYTFRIKAYKMDGKTALYSGYTTISARTNPSATTGLKLKARAADALRLTWAKNTSADGYIIEMKSGNSWTRVGKITNNATVEFKKSKLKAGTAYTFRIKAYKMSGKTALYGATKTISVRTNPSAVSGLKLKASAKNAVRLSWTKNTSADGYIVEIKVNGVWKRAGKITKNSTVEFKKSGLKSGTAYTFRAKAYKMSGKTALYSGYKTIAVKTK